MISRQSDSVLGSGAGCIPWKIAFTAAEVRVAFSMVRNQQAACPSASPPPSILLLEGLCACMDLKGKVDWVSF